MSLRDQLLKAGAISKKDADRVNRELKEERKKAQGARRSSADEEAEAKAKAAKEAEARLAQQRADREEDARRRERHEHRFRVRQIVLANRMAGRGPVPFHFRQPLAPGEVGPVRVGCMWLRESVARDLRNGGAAIVAIPDDAGRPVVHLVTRRAVAKLAEIEPAALVHHAADASHLGDPAESLMQRAWQTTGSPHRVRDDAELRALRDREQARDAARVGQRGDG
jgi:uncharacterized protein YaiL (DUF2058 family)